MSYSCTDFTDSVLDALKINVPEESEDSPSDQADLALEEIQRLQRIEKAVKHALARFDDMQCDANPAAAVMFVGRIRHVVS